MAHVHEKNHSNNNDDETFKRIGVPSRVTRFWFFAVFRNKTYQLGQLVQKSNNDKHYNNPNEYRNPIEFLERFFHGDEYMKLASDL